MTDQPSIIDRRPQIKVDEVASILHTAGVTADQFRGIFSWDIYMVGVLIAMELREAIADV